MPKLSLWPFQSPSNHEAVSAIIRRRSINSTDVREAVFDGLDLSFAKNVLDLGCGFGFMSEALAKRTAPGAELVGVDIWESNEAPYVARVASTDRQARFFCARVGSKFPCPDQGYDLVLCSYSLYFFVDALPEVARVLAPHGLFLAVTHSDRSFVGLLRAVGLDEDSSKLLALSRNFSAENGRAQLAEHFGEITRTDYHNSLRFKVEHADELLAYLRFKLPLLVAGSKAGDELPEPLARYARNSLERFGEVIVEKDDAVFRCRRPLCH